MCVLNEKSEDDTSDPDQPFTGQEGLTSSMAIARILILKVQFHKSQCYRSVNKNTRLMKS